MDKKANLDASQSQHLNKNQKSGLNLLLHIDNKSQDSDKPLSEEDKIAWKIIVYDEYCKNIFSTQYKVGDLRGANITLHLDLHKKREKIHGVKAIYFVQPNLENINKIIEDFEQDLYDYVYITFPYPISQDLLQRLATKVGKIQQAFKIKAVQQHSLNFVSLSKTLFTFNYSQQFRNISSLSQKASSPENSSIIYQLSVNLYCVCRQMNAIPTIVFRQGNPVHQKICDNLIQIFQTDYLNSDEFQNLDGHYNQYTLVLHDRAADLGSVLLHPYHYGALVHDMLHIVNNKVEMNGEGNKINHYDLDPEVDQYWEKQMNSPFPDVLEATPKEVENWKQKYESMDFRKQDASADKQSESISKALDEVTSMKDMKQKLDMHTNIAFYITQQIQERQVDQFFEIGSSLIFNGYLQKDETKKLTELIESKQCHESDKLRLMILYAIYDQDHKYLEELIEKSGIKKEQNLKILEFVKTLNTSKKNSDSKTDMLFNFAKNMARRVNISKEKDFYLVDLIKQVVVEIQNVIQNRSINAKNIETEEAQKIGIENYAFQSVLTPQQSKYKINKGIFSNDNIKNMILFCVEGGGYSEYQAVCEYAKNQGKNTNIIYGGSTIFSAKDLLFELSEIV